MRRLYNRFSYRREPLNLNDKQFELWLQFVRRADESGTQVRVYLAAVAGGGLAIAFASLPNFAGSLVTVSTAGGDISTLAFLATLSFVASLCSFGLALLLIYRSWKLQKVKSLTRRRVLSHLELATSMRNRCVNTVTPQLLNVEKALFPRATDDPDDIKNLLFKLTGDCEFSKGAANDLAHENSARDDDTGWLLVKAYLFLFCFLLAGILASWSSEYSKASQLENTNLVRTLIE